MGVDPYPTETQKFLDLYVEKHGKDRWWGPEEDRAQIPIATTVGSGYDCANLLFTAIKNAGSTEAAAVVAEMEKITDFPGASVESISFSEAKHDALTVDGLTMYEMRATDNGMALKPLEAQK